MIAALLRLSVAAALGAVIGFDRELHAKPAGLRTNMVVAIATAAFAYIGSQLFEGGDPTRIASQVVTGIGFLGGGAIFASGGKPHGLTTAAALWAAAAVGVAAGLGRYAVASAIALVVVVVLWPFDRFVMGALWPRFRHIAHFQILAQEPRHLTEIRAALRHANVSTLEVEVFPIGEHLTFDAKVVGRLADLRAAEAAIEQIDDVALVARPSADL
jgi:uncharacterized membrane protein YhiD involved in acid resistance